MEKAVDKIGNILVSIIFLIGIGGVIILGMVKLTPKETKVINGHEYIVEKAHDGKDSLVHKKNCTNKTHIIHK